MGIVGFRASANMSWKTTDRLLVRSPPLPRHAHTHARARVPLPSSCVWVSMAS